MTAAYYKNVETITGGASSLDNPFRCHEGTMNLKERCVFEVSRRRFQSLSGAAGLLNAGACIMFGNQ